MYRANGVPTEAEKIRHGKLIRDQKQELERIKLRIQAETERLSVSTNAVMNLEGTLSKAKDAWKALSENLSSLRDIENRLNDLLIANDQKFSEEPQSRGLGEKTLTIIEVIVARSTHPIQEQISHVDNEARNMRSHVRQLECELEGWQFSKKLAEGSLLHMLAYAAGLEDALMQIRSTLCGPRMVPSEVWTKVFDIRVEEDLAEYLKTKEYYSFKPTIMTLSQVSRQWRRIIKEEPGLWRYIPACSYPYWAPGEESLLRYMLSYSGNQRKLVTCFPETDSARHSVYMENSMVVPSQQYSLIIKFDTECSNFDSPVPKFPFRQPSSLTLYAAPNFSYDIAGFSCLSSFRNIQELHIYNLERFESHSTSTIIPTLKVLSIQLTNFTSFDLGQHIPPDLQRLYIRHDGIGRFNVLTEQQFGSLRVLGFTLFEITVFKAVRLPKLRKLVVYPIKEVPSRPLEEILADLPSFIGQITSLELYDGTRQEQSNGAEVMPIEWPAVSIFEKLFPHATRLASVKFIESLVDGEELIRVLSSKSDKTSGLEVTLEYCTGEKAVDWQPLQAEMTTLVDRLKVLV